MREHTGPAIGRNGKVCIMKRSFSGKEKSWLLFLLPAANRVLPVGFLLFSGGRIKPAYCRGNAAGSIMNAIRWKEVSAGRVQP